MFRALVAALFLLAGPALAQDDEREETAHQAFDAYVPVAPVIVPGPNGPHLVHELHLTNFASATLTLEPLGEYESIEAMNSGGPWREDGGLVTPSFPAPMMVVRFPD